MTSVEPLIGFLLVVLASGLVILLSIRQKRQTRATTFRRIAAISKFKRAVAMSVEDGTRIHVSLGNASLTQPASASAFISLATLHRIGQLSSTSDFPPVATSGDGALAILSQDTLHQVARETHTLELYNPDQGQLAGITPMSNMSGALRLVSDPEVKTNVLIGNFGSEAGFLSTASQENGDFTLAASDSLPAQAVFYATVEQPLIGEELFAVPAYLQPTPMHSASLQVQDILRGLVILTILCGSILKLLGIL